MYKIWIFLLVWLCCFCSLFAQNQTKLDSLSTLLTKELSEQQRVDIYNLIVKEHTDSAQVKYYVKLATDLAQRLAYTKGLTDTYYNWGWKNMTRGNYQSAARLFNKLLAISQKKSYQDGLENAYRGLGITYYLQGLYPKALTSFQKSLMLARAMKNQRKLASNYNNLGLLYQKLNNYPQALKYIHQSLNIKERMGNKKGIASSYNNLGLICFYQKKYAQALKYYQKSLDLSETQGDESGNAISYHNIGSAYHQQGDYTKALAYLEKGQLLAKKLGDKSTLAFGYQILGELEITRKRYVQARKYFLQAYQLNNKIGEVPQVALNNIALGRIAYLQAKYPEALTYLKQGIDLASGLKRADVVRDGVKVQAQVYEAMKDFEQAYASYQLFKRISDSLLNQQSIRKMANIELEHAFSKREDSLKQEQREKIELFKVDQERRKANQRATYIGLSFALLLVIVLVLFYYNKQRSNRLLNKTNQRLVALDGFKQQMMGMIVHDLKNPLNTIIGLSETQPDPKFLNINRSGKRMHSLIMNLLDVQKMEESEFHLQQEKTTCKDLITVAVQQIDYVIQDKKQQVKVQVLSDAYVAVDKDLLIRVLVNLLSNAVKYTPENKSIQVCLMADTVSGVCKITVEDAGIGIAPEHIDKVFEKYYQVAPQKLGISRSTGLGLAFCKLAVELNQGSIGVNSTPGKGAAFWFTLPIIQVSEAQENNAEEIIYQKKSTVFKFTPQELKLLYPLITKIRQHQIYEVGAIRQALLPINDSLSKNLQTWKMELEDALYASNEERFDELLTIVDGKKTV